MRFKKYINVHTILIFIVIITVVMVVFRFLHWGVRVNLDDFADEYTDEYKDNLDIFLPAVDENGSYITDTDDVTTIVCFGNAPFADDRDSENNLASLIAAKTGATVYNCSVSGSYLAALEPSIDPDGVPMDIFNFYWLTQLAVGGPMEGHWKSAMDSLADNAPPEAGEVYDTLSTIDFNSVDVIAIMYDASDYLAGHAMYSDLDSTDIMQFTGNLEAGIGLLQDIYPHIRIIVMSPAYAYAVDKDGNYVSSDQYTYGWDVLSTYAIKEYQSCMDWGVTFVDHIYGTITEDNAKDYLIDNLHLNVRGRELVADRFIEALNAYN